MQLDSDIAAALAAAANATASPPERDDVLGLRKYINQMLTGLLTNLPSAPDVDTVAFEAAADDSTAVPLRWYTRERHRPGSAIVYVHGGGRICGSVDVYEPLLRHYVQLTGVPFLAMDYRLAPEFHDTIPTGDAFAATQWVFEHADRNTTPDPSLTATATWTYDDNYTGWHALLGDALGGPLVSPIAAPARLDNFAGLAPAYIEVGELDIFRDESIDYARNLVAAGVSCELHLVPGAPHAHDLIGMTFPIGRRSLEEKIRVITSV
jgi:acetyl esterase/lipase